MVFAADWADLQLSTVEGFLAEAEEEGLTWEAKAGDVPRSASVAKAVCGLANSQGGYLILGAERKEGKWKLPGVLFRGGEASTWLTSVVATTLNPVPQVDLKAWNVTNERIVAVVRVEPLAVRPCITNRGLVFERTSGQTLPVTDPAVLARL